MFFIYVLLCSDGNLYVGFTTNLKQRLKEHQNGQVNSTKHRLPVDLIYYKACKNRETTLLREKYLKTAWGKRYLNKRIKKHYLTGVPQ